MKRLFAICLFLVSCAGVSQAPRAGALSGQQVGGPTEGVPPGGVTPPTPTTFALFSVSKSTASTVETGIPVPNPQRPCCGDAWDWIQTGTSTYNFGGLDNWLSNATANSTKLFYSFNEVSGYVNGSKPYSFPPTDVNTTNTSATTFATKVMQRYCHTSTPPAAPGACDIENFEGWNEFNTGSNLPCTHCGFWSGTYAELARMDHAFITVVKLYCPLCKVYAGSTTAGGDGFNPGGGSSQYNVAMLQFLQSYKSQFPAGPKFDGVTFHPYPTRTNVFPEPWPTEIKSDSSPLCTGSANSTCRTPVSQQVTLMKTTLCDASIASDYCGAEIGTTEGGFNHNENFADTKNVSLSGSGTTVTATSTTDLPADWVTGIHVVINRTSPTSFQTTPTAVTITKTGTRTFTYPSSVTGTSSSGIATSVKIIGGNSYQSDATWTLRRAWLAQWMAVLAMQGTSWNLAYLWNDECWMTFYGSGSHFSGCPKDPLIASGATPMVQAYSTARGWLVGSTGYSTLQSSTVGSYKVYWINFTKSGSPARMIWYNSWRTSTNFATPAGFTTATRLDGTTFTPGATIPVGNEPMLLQ